jgi:hypothetical protein
MTSRHGKRLATDAQRTDEEVHQGRLILHGLPGYPVRDRALITSGRKFKAGSRSAMLSQAAQFPKVPELLAVKPNGSRCFHGLFVAG